MRDTTLSTKHPSATILLVMLLASGVLAVAAAPSATAHATTCQPGSGGVGGQAGMSDGAAAAWNCAGATYTHHGDTTITVSALSYGMGVTL